MKFSIEQHMEMLENNHCSVERERGELSRMAKLFAEHEARYEFYKEQIEVAKSMGKDGFDSERFMQKKSPQ